MGAYEFLFSCRHPYLSAQVIGFHGHAAFEAIFTSVQDRLGRLQRLLGEVQLFFGQQHAVIRIHHVENDFLFGAFELMPGCVLDAFCPVHGAPARERIEQIPGSAETCGEVAERRRGVQRIEREVSCGEPLLPQFAAENIYGIVAARRCLGKHDSWQQEGSSLLYVSGGRSGVRERRFALRIVFERDLDRLRKSEGRRLLCLLCKKLRQKPPVRGMLPAKQFGSE